MNEKDQIKAFIIRITGFTDLLDDQELIKTRSIDSIMALQLVNFVEAQFGIVVDAEDVTLENFGSINAIADMVNRKRG